MVESPSVRSAAATGGKGGVKTVEDSNFFIKQLSDNAAVFLQRPALGESIQAEDRVHRIGSEIHAHGVEIIDIVARDSVDSRRRELLKEHAGQLAEYVRDPRIVRGLLGGLRS